MISRKMFLKFLTSIIGNGDSMSEIESYLEDNRPTLDEVCEEYKECTEKCPAWKFCKGESEDQE